MLWKIVVFPAHIPIKSYMHHKIWKANYFRYSKMILERVMWRFAFHDSESLLMINLIIILIKEFSLIRTKSDHEYQFELDLLILYLQVNRVLCRLNSRSFCIYIFLNRACYNCFFFLFLYIQIWNSLLYLGKFILYYYRA